jgi:hypothetical protein
MEHSFFTAPLLKLAGWSEEDAKAALLDDAGEAKADALEIFNAKVVEKFSNIAKDQYKRGEREKAKLIEKSIKPIFEKYGINSERVEDGLNELTEKLATAGTEKTDPAKLTADDIKRLPVFQSVLDDAVGKLKNDLAATMSEYESYKAGVQREKISGTVSAKARTVLEQSKAAFAQNASSQVDFFIRAIGTQQFNVTDTGDVELLDKDGQPLRDDHSNRVSFDDYIRTQWQAAGYGFHDTTDPATSQPGTKTASGLNVTQANAQDLLRAAGNDKAKRAEILTKLANQQAGK